MFDDTNLPAQMPKLSEIVDLYDARKAAIPELIAEMKAQAEKMESACSIRGEYGGSIWHVCRGSGRPEPRLDEMERVLLSSAWQAVINGLQVKDRMTESDLSKLKLAMQNPPEFTLDNIRATFGTYLEDPRFHVLRGVAEAFDDLDPAYKSHSKIKIGVAGLPKRIIVSPHHAGKVFDVINALAVLDEKPRLSREERKRISRCDVTEINGIKVKNYNKGTTHLYFAPDVLRKINLALAEFYGDALANDFSAEEDVRPKASRAVSKKLQYYPSPRHVVKRIVPRSDYFEAGWDGEKWDKRTIAILEPSCGCGRILEGVRQKFHHVNLERRHQVTLAGIEFDVDRAIEARTKGFPVLTANFLQVEPSADYDFVLMNPPFAGQHWKKHIIHALKFLKTHGQLRAVLPATAWYDDTWLQELTDGRVRWEDFPIASFAESGTNVQTGFVKIRMTEELRCKILKGY